MNVRSLLAEREHLGSLLEAAQRCVYFMHASATKLPWPLTGPALQQRHKDEELFESLAAFNERFAKLQDTVGAAMRHAALLMGEATSPFLKVLALFEKLGVIDSISSWQLCRTARNLAAHDYETDYAKIAEHFNDLHALRLVLIGAASRLLAVCQTSLDIKPATADFDTEFNAVCRSLGVEAGGRSPSA